MPSNGDRWNGTVGDPSIGTETMFRPTRLPLVPDGTVFQVIEVIEVPAAVVLAVVTLDAGPVPTAFAARTSKS